MKKLVFKYYRSSLTEAQANVKWTYEGQVKSIDDINSEVMAEFFEKKGITDMETLRSIVKENRSFAEKFVDWLNRIIQRITGTKEQRFLLKVRNQWKKALREVKEGIKNTPAEAGVESLYSISRPLKDTDLADYLQAGKRRNKGKQEALERGEKIILTSDEEIRDYILSAIRGNVDMPTVAYAKVSKELSDAVKEANKAFDIEDSYLELVASDLRHAYLSHHKAKEPGDIDLADADFLNIPNYLENFDRIEKTKAFKSGKQEIVISAKNKDGRLIIIEIVSRSRNSLMFKTMWGLSEEKYNKRSAANSRGNLEDSSQALRFADTSSENSILDSQENVNKKSVSEKDGSERISDNIGSEVSFSVTKDDALFEKAVNRNAKLQNVSDSVLNEAGRVREAIKALYQDKFIADEMSKGSTRQGNGSYGVSFENTTICSRSLALESIVEAVAKKIGRPLNERESIIVAQEFMQYSPNPECLYCYQANAKRGFENALNTYLEYRKAAIERHRQGMSFEENLEAHLRSGRSKSTRTARQEARVRTWIRIAENEVPKAPAIYFTSTKAINDAIADPKIPKAIKDQLKDAKSFAQGASRAHKRMYYAAYNGEILKIKQSKIDEWNGEYGIRMYSFSDFSPAFILENMQMVTDAAVRGAKMLAYTKEADFVNIFGSTGMAINISVAGYESNGEFICDGMQGMEWEEAKALRNKYPAAGVAYVAKSDREVEWAMDQEWIDTVIPFHISFGSASMAEAMNWQNYTQIQSEKAKDGGSVTKLEHQSVYPPEHLNDKDTYLAKCEEYGLVPKFERWIDHPGYMKLVNETRLATNEMAAVQPVFNEEAAKECLNEFAGYDQPVGGSERAKNFVVDSIGSTLSEKGEGQKKRYSLSFEKSSFVVENKDAKPSIDKQDISYDTLVSKPDMPVILIENTIPMKNGKFDRAEIKRKARENIRSKNHPFNTAYQSFVRMQDAGIDVLVNSDGLGHGLARKNEVAMVTAKAGDILESSIVVNVLKNRGIEECSLVTLGVCEDSSGNLYPVRSIINVFENSLSALADFKVYSKLYGLNTKKIDAAKARKFKLKESSHFSAIAASTISIRDLLDSVKDQYGDILSNDVLAHYGTNRAKSELSDSVMYSITKKNQRQAASALVAELKESLGQRKTGQKELNALLKSIKDKILDTGAYSYSDVEDVLEQAYSTGGEMEAMADDIAEAKEYLKGQRIYIPKDVRSDVGLNGSLSASNRKMVGNRTSFTTDDSVEGIDVFYREISAEFPSLFPADIYDASEQAKLIYGIATASDRFVSFEQMDNEAEKEGAKPEELIYETMRKDIEDTFKSLARLNAYDEAKPQEKKESSKKNDAEKQRIKDEEGTMRTFDKIRAADRKQRIKEDQEALRLFDKLMREKDRNFEALDHSWKVKTARLVKRHKKELDKELERATKEVNKARDKREKEVAESYDKIIRDYERGRIKDEERALKLFDKILAEDEALALEFLEIGDFRNVDRVVAFYDRILKSERAKAETKRKAEEALKRREEVMKSRAKDRAAHKERMKKAKEMLRESNKAARANIPKGSRRDMYLKNRSSQKVAKGFVGDILNVLMRIEEGFLTENDISVIKNSKGQEIEVVFDENGQILYERKPGMEHWDISTRVNELTPGLALVYEAEQQGIDGDQFYTIYAALKGQVPDTPIKGLRNVTTKKAKQMRYINSLDLTARQKNFLYLDVCNFYSDGMPLFQDGGTNKAVKGNRRGRLARMLDEIALDMYAGNTIELKTVNDLVDLALGTERNEQWQKFHRFVMDEIVEASELMLKTKIITEMPVNSKKVKNKGGLKDEFRTLYSRFVAEGEGIETMGKHVDDPLLTARYYAAKASRSVSNEMIFGKSQRDLLGKEVGKSLNKIFKPIAGNEEKMDTLTKYCNYRHDIYRLKYDKGYTGLSVEELEERCRSIEKSDPDIVAIADEVVGYARNLLKMCVQANRISQADYEFFVERYPYYVPTFRVTVDEVLRDNKVKFRKIRVIKEAQGGSEELLPLFEQLVRRTHEMIKACKLNMLAQQIAMNARKPESRPFVEQPIPAEDTVKEDVAADIASMGAVEDVGQRTKERGFNNYIPWWSNGKQYNIPVTDEHVLYAWDRINYKIDENLVHKVLRNVNNVRRGVLTQYSPTFPITNGIRDYFDMFIYNKHAHRLPKFHALALKGIFTRSGKVGEMFNEYMSYGATNASIFEYANTNAGKKPRYTKARAVFEKIDAINFMIEQSPRFAVYLETVDRLEKQRKKGKNKYTDEEIKTIASYNAADATLNFGRSGTYIKAANTYGITFINAGFQGADRLRRTFTQVKGESKKETFINITGLIVKGTLLGIAPHILSDIVWNSGIMRAIVGDDDYDRVKREYDEMSDFTKINYLVFWINGTWVKIPTGRALSWIYSHVYLTKEVLDGDMDPLDAIIAQVQNFAENILPANPVTNGILGPLVEVALNKNWMGYAIVDDWYKREDGFRYLEYDEDTTEAAKAIAAFGHYITGTIWGREDSRVLDLSPMKLDYLMQQYFGSYSGIVMPFLSGSQVSVSEKGYEALMSMAQKFYTDPVYSNRLANDYYTAKNYVDAVTEVYDRDTPYAVASDYFKEHGEKLKEVRDEINAVNRNTNLSRKERKEKARELRERLNDLYREGLNGWEDILGYAIQNYDGKDRNKSTYNDAVGSVKGVEYSISTLSDTAQEQYKACSADGVSAEDFYDAYKFSQEVKSTRDANGKEVEGESKQDKVTAYLESRDASAAEKKSMWKNLFGYKSDPPAFSDGGSVSYNPGTAGSPILDSSARISSGYGPRNAPTAGASSYHRAIDIAAPGGTAVAAAMNGTVTRVSRSGGYGISVEVTTKGDDGNSYVTKYSHLLNTGVEVGQNVQKGVKIAEVDSTGTSTGNHLDFKLAINGDWVDPTQYLTAIGNGSLTDSGYSTKGGSGGSSTVRGGGGGKRRSGGGSRRSGGGSRKSGGSLGTFAVAGREDKATVKDVSNSDGGYTFSRQESGTSGSSAVASSKPVSNHAGTSTKNEKYASHGAYLPKASDSPYLPRYSDIASSNTRTKKTTRSNGRSMWDESVLG